MIGDASAGAGRPGPKDSRPAESARSALRTGARAAGPRSLLLQRLSSASYVPNSGGRWACVVPRSEVREYDRAPAPVALSSGRKKQEFLGVPPVPPSIPPSTFEWALRPVGGCTCCDEPGASFVRAARAPIEPRRPERPKLLHRRYRTLRRLPGGRRQQQPLMRPADVGAASEKSRELSRNGSLGSSRCTGSGRS